MANNRLVWFLLVDGEGQPFRGTTASSVFIPSDYVIDQFRRAVKEEYKDSHLKGIAPSDLVVYANKEAFERKGAPLGSRDKIGEELGRNDELYVVVPEPLSAARPRYFIAPEVQKKVEKAVFLIVEGESNEVGIGMGVFFTTNLAVTCDHNLTPEQTVGSLLTIQSGKANQLDL